VRAFGMFSAAPMSPGGGPVGRGREGRAVVSSWPLPTRGVPHGRPDGFSQGLLLSLGERGASFVTCFIKLHLTIVAITLAEVELTYLCLAGA